VTSESSDAGTPAEAREVDRFVRGVVTRITGTEPTLSLAELLPHVYDELRALADAVLRKERSDHTLRPTALVHEAYLRLARETNQGLQGRTHVLALAATTMRRVLIDYARRRQALKRGSGGERVSLRDHMLVGAEPSVDLLDLDRALDRLEKEDPRKARVTELLYFAGLTFEEAGAALGVSSKTVVRDWRYAKAWLWRALSASAGD
jgi:RNA polymerase sigma factor (TIGR02999 family)